MLPNCAAHAVMEPRPDGISTIRPSEVGAIHPNGVAAFSPGLSAVADYPGWAMQTVPTPTGLWRIWWPIVIRIGLVLPRHGATPLGLFPSLRTGPQGSRRAATLG